MSGSPSSSGKLLHTPSIQRLFIRVIFRYGFQGRFPCISGDETSSEPGCEAQGKPQMKNDSPGCSMQSILW